MMWLSKLEISSFSLIVSHRSDPFEADYVKMRQKSIIHKFIIKHASIMLRGFIEHIMTVSAKKYGRVIRMYNDSTVMNYRKRE